MGRLEGRATIVTGGASGMGAATAALWLAEGARVVIGDLNAGAGQAFLAEMRAAGHGDRIRFVRTDVSEEADVAALVGEAVCAFGGLDVMFNNAGVDGAFGPVTDIDVTHWDRTFAILTRGVFLGIKHAARAMQAAGKGGSIVNTASLAGLSAGFGALAYSAAKAGVVSLTQTAALELGPHNIRVNCICPGIVYTPLMHRGKPEAADAVRLSVQPLPIRGEALHIAEAALFFASDASAFVTGDAMRVDGGVSQAGPLAKATGIVAPARKAGMSYGMTGVKTESRTLEEQ